MSDAGYSDQRQRAVDGIDPLRRSWGRGRSDEARPSGGAAGARPSGCRPQGTQKAPRGDKVLGDSQGADRGKRCKKPGLPLWRRWFAAVIAVDTSALMAIALGETAADACIRVLETETQVMI